jgi:predicted permease
MILFDRLFRRGRIYDDLSDEIRAHLEEKVDELVARGMSRTDARNAARRAFGNVTRVAEAGRETWQWPALESFIGDLHYALRQVRRAPVLPLIIVVTLALGIAATTTVFSWTRSVLLDPLPGAGDARRVMALETTTASGSWTPVSWLDYVDLRKYLVSFDGMAAAYPTSLSVGDDRHTERQWGELVSANFFDVLRVRPALGAFFPAAAGDVEGSRPTVVIGYDLWQTRWHGDSSALGSVVEINRFPFTVIGVAPPAFHGSMPGQRFELWVPAAMLGQIVPTGGWWLHDRGTRTFRVLARLAPGVSLGAARADVDALTARMRAANAENKGMSGLVLPIWQSHWGMQDALRAPLLVLLAACGLVLLIVCVNAAGLLLARALGRRRELGLRLALGAPRGRLLRQLLTEASLLAVTGTGLGLLCTVWLARSLRLLVPAFVAGSLRDPHVDGGVLLFTAALAAIVTLLAGVAPAIHGSRHTLTDALNDSRSAGAGVRVARLRGLLVAAEMALAIVALAGAGLFYDSFRHTRQISPGFDASHVAIGSVSLTLAGYDSARGEQFLGDVAERITRLPGVSAASYTDYVPLSIGSGSWEDLRVEGYAPAPGENMKLTRAVVGPGYFDVLRIRMLEGRDFRQDDDSSHAAVMIVNEAFVHHFLPGRAALGVRVHGWGRWFTIVGVVRDTKTYRLTDPAAPYFYVPVRQVYRPEYGYTFVARTTGSVDQLVSALARSVREIHPGVTVFNAMPLADYIDGPLESERTGMQLLSLLAGVASLLAAIGLYGVISFAVAQRTKEIGVRIALGAQRTDVLRVVGGQAVLLSGFGLVAGLAGAVLVARLVSSMLFGVGAGGLAVFGAAAAAMATIALVATVVPARRAMRVDPTVALRVD